MQSLNPQPVFPNLRLASLALFVFFLTSSSPLAATQYPKNLLDVYHKAEDEDPQLIKGRASRYANEEIRNQTKAKALLPSVSLSANVTGNFQNIILLQQDTVGNGGHDQFVSGGYNVTLTQPVFHYDRLIAMDQAGQRVEQSEVELDTIRQDLILRVAERYFNLLAAMDNLRVAQAQKASLTRQKEQTHQRFDVGEIAVTDVAEAEAGNDRAGADEIEAQQQLDDAKAALREITGEDYSTLSALVADIPLAQPEPMDENRWTEQAMAQNPRIVAAAIAAEVASKEISRRSSEHLPSLDLVAGNGFFSTGGQFGAYQIYSNNVGITMNLPLYEGGQISSRSREAAYRLDEVMATLKQEQRAVHRQTLDAFRGIITGVSRVQALRKTMSSQELSVGAIRASIEVGSRTTLDLINAERDWYRVQRDYAKSRYDYLLNTLRLKRSAGILAEDDLVKINSFLTGHAPAARP
jgi:outer membrane protein